MRRDQARVQARIFIMDHILCLVCRAGSSAVVRLNFVFWHGLRWNTGYGLGLDHCHGLHSMRRYGHG
jgi:hypothetical protein